MDWFLVAIGMVLALAGIVDVLATTLFFEGHGIIPRKSYRLMWSVGRPLFGLLPTPLTIYLRTLLVPVLAAVTPLVWILLELFGFGLVFFAGSRIGALAGEPGVAAPKSLSDALYMSGVTLSTLGYGDITPIAAPFRIVSFTEALVGFTIITLTVSYVLSINSAVRQQGHMVAVLTGLSGKRSDCKTIVAPFLRNPLTGGLDSLLQQLTSETISYRQNLNHYPLLYYNTSKDARESVSHAFYLLGRLYATLRFCTHREEVSENPWLSALGESFERTMKMVELSFVSGKARRWKTTPPIVPEEEFHEQVSSASEKEISDPWIAQFTETYKWIAETEPGEEWEVWTPRYRNYVKWVEFVYHVAAFSEAMAWDLGYDALRARSDFGAAQSPNIKDQAEL